MSDMARKKKEEEPLDTDATLYAFDRETHSVFVSHSDIDTKTLAVATGIREAMFDYLEELRDKVEFGGKFKSNQDCLEWCYEYLHDMLKKHGVDLTIFD